MVVWSSLTTVPYNCYEIGHNWSPNCPEAIFMFTAAVFRESVKLYVGFYVISFLIKRRKLTKENLSRLLKSISTSVFFLTSTGFFYLFYTCAVRHSLGHFNVWTASFVPGILANLTSIFLEQPNRVAPLAGYVTNVAIETLFRMLVYRGLLKPIHNGEVILFSCSIGLFMYHIKKNGFVEGEILSSVIKFLFKSEDCFVSERDQSETKEGSGFVPEWLRKRFSSCLHLLDSLPRHESCPHKGSCISFCANGYVRGFTVAYACQAALNVARQLFSNPRHALRAAFDRRNLNLGIFLGLFTGVYKTVSCCLRWMENRDSSWHAIPAGIVAGTSMYFYKRSTIAVYVMWKILEIVYEWGMNAGYFPRTKLGLAMLYSVSAGLLFHSGVVEPHNLRSSYYKFLNRITGGLVDLVNRHLMDDLNIESSKRFPDYRPKLEKSFMTAQAIDHMTRIYPSF